MTTRQRHCLGCYWLSAQPCGLIAWRKLSNTIGPSYEPHGRREGVLDVLDGLEAYLVEPYLSAPDPRRPSACWRVDDVPDGTDRTDADADSARFTLTKILALYFSPPSVNPIFHPLGN